MSTSLCRIGLLVTAGCVLGHGTDLDCPADGIVVTNAGTTEVDGCYIPAPSRSSCGMTNTAPCPTEFVQSAGNNTIFQYAGAWWIGRSGVVAFYGANCVNSTKPPATGGWHVDPSFPGVLPVPTVGGAVGPSCVPPTPPPPAPPSPHPNCSTPECDALWGPGGCPDLYSIAPDLVRPAMTNATPAAGARVRATAPGFEGTQAYHALYLPQEWTAGTPQTYAIIVEYMGNGPWSDGHGDISTGRPEDSNLGWGMANPAGTKYIWISMPFLTSAMGNATEISTYWWGCPTVIAQNSCGAEYDMNPTLQYLHSALEQTIRLYGGDSTRVAITGWSRGAIATGAVGLHDDATSQLFKAFIPYSHLDGDCGWVDQDNHTALQERWTRLGGRPTLYLGECAVATSEGPLWLKTIGQNGTHATSAMEFMTTGFANHNDAWVLRNSTARTYMRQWLVKALA